MRGCAREAGRRRRTVKGRSQILHAPPVASFVIRTKGLSPRHVSHNIGIASPTAEAIVEVRGWRAGMIASDDASSPQAAVP